MRRPYHLLLVVACLALLAGCDRQGEQPAAPRQSPTGSAAPSEARAPVAAEGHIGVLISGQVVDVASEVEGQLRSISVRLGDRISRGARLAQLDDRDLRQKAAMARASLKAAAAKEARARVQHDQARQQLARRKELPGAVSAEDLETAQYKLDTSRAEMELAKAEVAGETAKVQQLSEQLGKTTIRAPFAGFVALRYVDQGAVVKAGQPLVRLISTEGCRIRFAVPPERSARARVGRPIRVRLEALDLELPGTITHVAQEVDSASQMVFVEGTVTAPAGRQEALRAGLVGRVTIVDAPASRPARPR